MQSIVGVHTALKREPLPIDDPKQRRPDITQAQKLGFRPSTPLEEGLRRTVDYFRKRLATDRGVRYDGKGTHDEFEQRDGARDGGGAGFIGSHPSGRAPGGRCGGPRPLTAS